ncbi:MAG: isoprenylcysteine carboxylmethyltransferase family protein [Chloroflexi bacterium]|nr:isoprenylcysteine carboxylmethyltransferase family protein [Chloroflexota bacterium]
MMKRYRQAVPPVLRTLIFTLLVPGTVAGWVPYLLLARGAEWLPFQIGNFRFLGILPMLLGAAIYLWCAWEFAHTGKGTPAPVDAPQVLVVKGLYWLVRNPMYVGVELMLLGQVLLFQSTRLLIYAMVVGLVVHCFVVFREEPQLRKKFGSKYEEYCRAVPRWVPRLRRPKTG